MNACFKTFESGSGDCVFFILKDAEEQYAIMVDCGKLEQNIKDYIQTECHNHIDLLLVTHIDNDHIIGVINLLKDMPDVKIDEIIYNSYQRNVKASEKKQLPSQQQKYLNQLKAEIPIVADMAEHPIGAVDSFNLASVILARPELSKLWNVEPVTDETETKPLGKWGNLLFLSPSQKQLDKLNEVYLDYFFEKLYDKADGKKWKKGEVIYEYLIRFADQYNMERMKDLLIGSEKINAAYLREQVNEIAQTSNITPQNNASIAFVWENIERTKRVLFMGDANPDQIEKGIETKYSEESKPIDFEVIKVSHHGSHYNTTASLMSIIDSNELFFTGGEEGKRPSFSCIAKIVCRPIQEGKRHLHFNYLTEEVEQLKAAQDAQDKLSFDCETTNNSYEFIC